MTKEPQKESRRNRATPARRIAERKARKQAVAERIKAGMDGLEEVECGGYIARNKAVTTSRFDTKAFRAAYEFMYNDFCKPQTVQRFTVSAVA